MDRLTTGRANREAVEILARLAVMFRCTIEMGTLARLLDERQHTFNGCANVTNHTEIDRRTAADLFGPHINLRDAHPRTARIELAIRKIGAEHQENVTI